MVTNILRISTFNLLNMSDNYNCHVYLIVTQEIIGIHSLIIDVPCLRFRLLNLNSFIHLNLPLEFYLETPCERFA